MPALPGVHASLFTHHSSLLRVRYFNKFPLFLTARVLWILEDDLGDVLCRTNDASRFDGHLLGHRSRAVRRCEEGDSDVWRGRRSGARSHAEVRHGGFDRRYKKYTTVALSK